jgi:hypothetical protein
VPRPPRVLGLVLCERFAVDPAALEVSLLGVFHRFFVDAWPATTAFTVYAGLQGGRGEGTMQLLVTRLETEQDIYRYRRWFAVPDTDLTVHLEIQVRNCVFPAPGRYRVSLWIDNAELAARLVDLVERQGEA